MVKKDLAIRTTSNRIISFLMIFYHWIESVILLFIPMSMMKRKDVKNKIVLITGGGSGIGQQMALRFMRLGAKVVIWDVNEKGMEITKQMAKEEQLNIKNIFLFKVDITNVKQVNEIAQKVKTEIGFVDILVNNAGVVSGNNILDIPDEKIELTFKVNTISHFYTIKAFLPDMINKKSGHIVTIASTAGNIGVVGLTDYCASKYANVGMDFALRMELAKANLENIIKTTIVKPYFITTGMFAGADPGVFKFLKPEEVVDKVMEAILTETKQLFVPYFMDWLLNLLPMMPEKCILPIFDFIGGFEFMSKFHGREGPAKPATVTDEINNNDLSKKNNLNLLNGQEN